MGDIRMAMLPLEQMYGIGEGDEHRCHFDFSKIPYDQYTKFFNTLPNIIYKKCEKLRFSCDFKVECENRKTPRKRNQMMEQFIKDSISERRPKYLPYLMKIFTRVLPRAKALTSLHLSNLNIHVEYFDCLIDAIGQNTSLGVLRITNVTFDDNHCKKLLKVISPYQYETLSFNYCLITSHSYRAFEEFLQRPPIKPEQERTIRKINLEGSTMTDIELDNIDVLLYGESEDGYEAEEDEQEITNDQEAQSAKQEGSDYYDEEEDAPQNLKNSRQSTNDSYEKEQVIHSSALVAAGQPDEDEEESEPVAIQARPTQGIRSPNSVDIATMTGESSDDQNNRTPRKKTIKKDDYDYEDDEEIMASKPLLPAPPPKPKPAVVPDRAPPPLSLADEEEDEYSDDDVPITAPAPPPIDYDYEEDEEEDEPAVVNVPLPKPVPKDKVESDYEYTYDDELPRGQPLSPPAAAPAKQLVPPQSNKAEKADLAVPWTLPEKKLAPPPKNFEEEPEYTYDDEVKQEEPEYTYDDEVKQEEPEYTYDDEEAEGPSQSQNQEQAPAKKEEPPKQTTEQAPKDDNEYSYEDEEPNPKEQIQKAPEEDDEYTYEDEEPNPNPDAKQPKVEEESEYTYEDEEIPQPEESSSSTPKKGNGREREQEEEEYEYTYDNNDPSPKPIVMKKRSNSNEQLPTPGANRPDEKPSESASDNGDDFDYTYDPE